MEKLVLLRDLKEEAIKELKAIQLNGDVECAHGLADKALCDLLIKIGLQEVVYEWEKIEKWYA